MDYRNAAARVEKIMVAFNVVERFRHQHDLGTYRRRLANEIGQDILVRLIPAVLDLPLPLVGADGNHCTLEQALHASRKIALLGSPGAGRRLVLQQLALRLTSGAHQEPGGGAARPPALLALPRLDDGASAPDELLASALAHEPRTHHDGLGLFRRAEPDERAAHGPLLLYGWDELGDDRRAGWRAALLALAESAPAAQVVVALPPSEPAWPSFAPLPLAPLSPELLAEWLGHLAPAEHQAAILAALAPDGPLAPLAGRLLEIALLAWLTPRAGLPKSRAELYDHALAEALGVPAGRLASAPELAELQLLAAYDERPANVGSPLLFVGADARPSFVHAQVRRYLAARQLVAEGRFELLRHVAPSERAEMALLAATIADDSSPIFAALWGAGQPHKDDLLALGRCLRERPPRAHSWTLKVAAGLARLAHGGASLCVRAAELLPEIMPALDAALPSSSPTEKGQQFALRLLDLLPSDLAAPRLLRLIFHPDTPEPFGWALADRLAEREMAEQFPPAPPAEPLSQAYWLYLQAMGDPEARAPLDPTLVPEAIRALAGSAAGATRKLRVGAALLEDPAQPPAIRLAALAMLARNEQPAVLTVIERVSGDADPEVRGAALAALNEREPERAAVALGRAATDSAALWELRLGAIERLGEHIPRGAGRLLERCALDRELPLYARMHAAAALGRHPGGATHLLQILNDASADEEVRGMAAQTLGAARHAAALPDLIRLIEQPSLSRALAIGCCAGLGALGERLAGQALLRLLERGHNDTERSIAAIRALGQLGDLEAAEPLGRLLGGEALFRFQRGLEPRLVEQSVESCLHDPEIPRPIARRLSLAVAGITSSARPTTLLEFLTSEADAVRAAAAQALAAIGGNSARAALIAALLDGGTAGATAQVIAALAEVEGQDSAEALGYLLDDRQQDPLTSWLIVQQLTDHPAGEDAMRRVLARADVDSFTRGTLAEGLGQRRALAAIEDLRAIAEDSAGLPQLRAQSVQALGLMDDPAVEPILFRLIGDERVEEPLRGLAAENLPQQLSDEGRRALRELLRHERPAMPLALGALKALGRARDREALPLLLRYAQDESPAVAQSAIAALTELGDGSMAPMLVRITQSASADHALRLQAVGALLQIGGPGYRPLLRVYLSQGALPFRLLALEHLIGGGAPADELLALLADRGLPSALRLRLLDAFAGDTAAAPTLAGILQDADDDLQIRALAAEALGQMRCEKEAPTLIRLAASQSTPVALRLRCIDAARAIGETAAWATLSQLAEDHAQPAAVRDSAAQALRRAVAERQESLARSSS